MDWDTISITDHLGVFTLGNHTSPPMGGELLVQRKPLRMDRDAGAAVSIIPQDQLIYHYSKTQTSAAVVLQTYTYAREPRIKHSNNDIQLPHYKSQYL